ncbi:MAG: hypothetical protein P0Y62_10440 [Candidatus Chryseobacterium colombiense]|nr:hypothetical protein [Chryseobacterium sp.]WEK68286.1 MAG: hypothetical protein P0Y62_10440 [Chryseobacterium sp.]
MLTIEEIISKGKLLQKFQIEDEFEGFDDNKIFEFTNSEYWLQKDYKYWYYYAYRPSGKIYEYLSRTYLTIDNQNQFIEVEKIEIQEYTIISDFNGWKGDTIFEMDNGEIWKQDSYDYDYNYSYRPKAAIYENGLKSIMIVEGKSIEVKRIK